MRDAEVERFKQRLRAAGASIPDDIFDMVAVLAGPLILAQDELARLDLGAVEPFVPERLADDAG
jgi:hypothetical protein